MPIVVRYFIYVQDCVWNLQIKGKYASSGQCDEINKHFVRCIHKLRIWFEILPSILNCVQSNRKCLITFIGVHSQLILIDFQIIFSVAHYFKSDFIWIFIFSLSVSVYFYHEINSAENEFILAVSMYLHWIRFNGYD